MMGWQPGRRTGKTIFSKLNGGISMKGKVLLSLLVIALAGTLIAGAMGAWFTDDADVPSSRVYGGDS
jgi:glycerol uptake facilitator-like aquaporin